MRHLRSFAYSVELVQLNKQKICDGAPKLECYPYPVHEFTSLRLDWLRVGCGELSSKLSNTVMGQSSRRNTIAQVARFNTKSVTVVWVCIYTISYQFISPCDLSKNRRDDGMTGRRRDRMEHPSRSWRPYRCPDDETGRTTGRRDSLAGDDRTSNMFSHTN